MTNHHCSRDVVGPLQQEGENFDKQGFYAENLSDERKADGLFVEQLIMTLDITEEMKSTSEEELLDKYQDATGWEGLRLQVVTYYSGGKYSLYGYKRFDDIRLVWIPEVDLGFFGGDPDNFTYPRYNLDCTLWRAYDENGLPLNSSGNYLEFNIKGPSVDEPVFVVGNPGNTERYRTIAQLEYDRDFRYPMTHRFLTNRNDLLVEKYNELLKDPAKEFEAQELLNQIANVANGMKAYGGIVKGLNNPELFNRKKVMEEYIRSKSENEVYWEDLEKAYAKLRPHGWAVSHLSPNPMRGNVTMMINQIYKFEQGLLDESLTEEKIEDFKNNIAGASQGIDAEESKKMLKLWLSEIQADIDSKDSTLGDLLDGKSIDQYVDYLFKESNLTNLENSKKHLEEHEKLLKRNDPMQLMARSLMGRYYVALNEFRSSSAARKKLEAKIANEAFKVYGTSLPPDATFTLRISDGMLKSYDYNGTTAPLFTTFYGLYDRHYSNGEKFPWNLPERWMNPDPELLKTKFNCISTNDIIGGNSGSPLINSKGEAVGLIFDGNIESLPGNFIFDEKANRTVSVTSSGIYAALKYIFKADRLVKELEGGDLDNQRD
jgi:hypothetical protein